MNYEVLVTLEVQELLNFLDEKSRRIIKKSLKELENSPYPGKGSGDKEKLPIRGKMRFRMHIGRTWTVFYSIIDKEVRISEIIPIGEAHKKYGYK